MGWVWDFSPQAGNGLLMLLAMADHASDDGGNIYPSVQRLAHKVRVKERQAQYIISELEKAGAILRESQGGGRGHTARWRIRMDERVQNLAPIPERVQSGPERVQDSVVKGAEAIAPDPSGSVRREPSGSKISIPKDFMLTQKDIDFSKKHGIANWMEELDKFTDYYKARGTRWQDWHAVWRTWCRNSQTFAARNGTSAASHDVAEHVRKYPTADELDARRNGGAR